MDWKEFKESSREYPEKIVEKSIHGFHAATKGLVFMNITPIEGAVAFNTGLENDFMYSLDLGSEYLKLYRMRLLVIGYGVELFPASIILEDSLHESLYLSKKKHREKITVSNEHDLTTLLEQVFSTPRFSDIVSGVMKIARREKES